MSACNVLALIKDIMQKSKTILTARANVKTIQMKKYLPVPSTTTSTFEGSGSSAMLLIISALENKNSEF